MNIPKSLHTVTVLVAVAAELIKTAADFGRQTPVTPADAIWAAIKILGYADATDTYMLHDKAVAILSRPVQS